MQLVSGFQSSGCYSARHSGFRGATTGLPKHHVMSNTVMMKKGIHPKWIEDAPVYCNGEEVMRVGGTAESYNVDIWSGNHPFYQGITSAVVTDEGQVNRFNKRYAGLDSLGAMKTASDLAKEQKEAKEKKK